MDTIVSILLFMNVISSSGNYTMAQLNNYASIYSTDIYNIETSPGALPPILEVYEPEAIIVIDSTGG